MNKHKLHLQEGRSSLSGRCTCGKLFGRATGLNQSGYGYASAALASRYLAHLVQCGVVEMRPVERSWSRSIARALYSGGRLLGTAGQLYHDDPRARWGSGGYMRAGRWYRGRFASMDWSLYLLVDRLQSARPEVEVTT